MRIKVNGAQHTVEPACTVKQLLDRIDLRETACAVEVNARVIPKREHIDHALVEGDTVEIVTLVGGG